MKKTWLHYLLEADGRSFHVENGVVTTSATPKPLTNSPSGWDQVIITWERIMTEYGIQRAYTTPLAFILDNAKILREIFYNQSYERTIEFLMQQLKLEITPGTPDGFRWIYRYFYKGEPDLSTFKDDGTKVTVNIMEGGIARQIKANKATTYEIPIDEITIKMDGHYLTEKQNWEIQAGGEAQDHLIGVFASSKEGEAAGMAVFSVSRQVEPGNYATSNEYFFTVTQDILGMRLTGTLKFEVLVTSGTFNLKLKTSTGRTLTAHTMAVVQGQSYEVAIDYTFDAFDGEKFFIVADVPTIAIFGWFESTIAIEFKSRFRTTYIKALFPVTAFSRLVEKITGSSANGFSEFLGQHANLAITSFDAIRGITGAVIKTSLATFFEAYNVLLNCGMAIENKILILDRKEYFFDDSDPIDLGEVKDMEVSLATDLMANTFKIGYPNQDTEDVNGKYAFNNTHLYTSVLTKIVKEFSLISQYITDPYAIELVRINLEGKTTTDNSSDNKVAILNIDFTNPETIVGIGTVYSLKRVTYDSIEGIPSPETIYNIEELTPARLVGTHGNWIRSMLHWFWAEKLKYQTTEKNALLKTVINTIISSITVDEDADIEISQLADPLFIPLYFDFATEVPTDLVELLEANPNRCFRFVWDGQVYKGFNMKISQAPNTESEQKFRLLSTADNDLTHLII